MIPLTPDNLTRKDFQDRGYHVVKVEGWGFYPHAHRTDFLGIYDYLAFNDDGEIIAIQTTTKQHFNERKKKMLSKKTFGWWTQGGRRSILQGWYKESGVWVAKEEELTIEDWNQYQAELKRQASQVNKNSPLYMELFGESDS